MRGPDFFLIGAPKCGTTALDNYLSQHPEIFMAPKELLFFGSDLLRRKSRRCKTEDDYLAYFATVTSEKRAGESSVWYLASKNAAAEIRQFSPDANIIAMLRNPTELIYSLYSELRWNGDEELPTFEQALDAEMQRKRGEGIPRHAPLPQALFYRDSVRFTEQLKRYFDVFGRQSVHIIVYDDFEQDTEAEYRYTLEFLEVNPDSRPKLDVVNPNKVVRSWALQHRLNNPPPWLLSCGRYMIPKKLRKTLRADLRTLNTKYSPRSPINLETKARLQAEFAPEVERLSELIGRDLTHWNRE